jgi:NTP pyrophosphatase (non-canonical NTP hydrolase)
MTIQNAQQQVDSWIKTVGVRYFNELTNLGILMEEVGEFSRLMVRKYGEQSLKNPIKAKRSKMKWRMCYGY